MGIYCKGKVKGKAAEIETEFFVNSGADVVLLPRKMAEIIKPEEIGEGEFILADGSRVTRTIYKVEIELEDFEGKRKRCEAYATIEERKDAVSFEVLEKLGAIINVRKKKVIFED